MIGSFQLHLEKDANVIVVATGKKTTAAPAATGRGGIVQTPIAVTNAFFVDLNGDGFIPNKDTLGEPFPVSVRTGGQSGSGGD